MKNRLLVFVCWLVSVQFTQAQKPHADHNGVVLFEIPKLGYFRFFKNTYL